LEVETMMLAHCIECGCHDLAACHDDTTGGPCSWLALDREAKRGVCSACPDGLKRWNAGDRSFAVPTGPGLEALPDTQLGELDIDQLWAWSISCRLAAVPPGYLKQVPPPVAALIRQAKTLHPVMASGAADRELRGEPCPDLG
jgi:hypothetical protein